MQERRTTRLAGAAAAVLVVAVVAALLAWGYVRGTGGPAAGASGNPLAIGVVFAAVLTAGAVGLLIMSGRQEPTPDRSTRVDAYPPGGPAAGGGDTADSESTAAAESVLPAGEATQEHPVLRPRTALDPLGRRYGRHARQEASAAGGEDSAKDGPVVSELFHPLPDDLATTLHDQLFTHRAAGG